MKDIRQQVTVGIVCLVWLALALLTGEALSPTPLRLFSAAGTTVTIAALAYERSLWQWKLVRRFTGSPLLHGTWRGEVITSAVCEDGTPVPPIPAVLHVAQSASRVSVSLFTADSVSTSTHASLLRGDDGRWCLRWQFVNQPRPAARRRSQRHRGVAELWIGGVPGEGLRGEYFTDRRTYGELHLVEWSPRRYGSASTALAATDFAPAAPYAAN
ncbi:Cap15 family cyclic dinucleotide receptor domain-containing protein [Streptomyces sp. 900105755]